MAVVQGRGRVKGPRMPNRVWGDLLWEVSMISHKGMRNVSSRVWPTWQLSWRNVPFCYLWGLGIYLEVWSCCVKIWRRQIGVVKKQRVMKGKYREKRRQMTMRPTKMAVVLKEKTTGTCQDGGCPENRMWSKESSVLPRWRLSRRSSKMLIS